MALTRDDVILGLAFLLSFPAAVHVTSWAASEPTPPAESVEVSRTDSGTR